MSRNQYSITLTGNGSEPPFANKGLVLNGFGPLQFVVPAGLEIASLNPTLLSNYPQVVGEKFTRDKFAPIACKSGKYTGSNDLVFELTVSQTGCFDYVFEWTPAPGKPAKRGAIGSFQVAPTLTINGKAIAPDAIVVETVLTKCLGPLSSWDDHIKTASQTGYNMLHYTPLQELGASGSCYSIYDQLSISKSLFSGASTNEADKLAQVAKTIASAETQHGVLSMIDLVWNHTAHNSAWLCDHPEAAYNTSNAPHLKPAVVLDRAIIDYSQSIDGSTIDSLDALDATMTVLADRVIQPLKLWEYYVLDVPREMEVFAHTYTHSEPPPSVSQFLPFSPKSPSENAQLVANIHRTGLVRDPQFERFSLTIDHDVVHALLNSSTTFKTHTLEEKRRKFEDLLRLVNLNLYRDYDADVAAMIVNMRERIKYERLASHGPHLGPICKARPLLASFFTYITAKSGQQLALANNGWIYNHDPSVDFASSASRAYFRRDVIVWGDCVKLRYGTCPEDSPYLWQHMRTYTENMAKLFHAIRIDNCHSTPIHVAQYLLDAARRIRPDIYVTCELFTGSEEADSLFVKRLGINSLIREAMVAHDSWELGRVAHRYGGRPIASFGPVNSELRPTLPPALFMDCTHDNQTPAQKRSIEDTLPNAAIVAFSVAAIGSTRGYDEIYPATIDLVNETRTYPPLDVKRGLMPLKTKLNKIHFELAANGYTEVHVHQEHNVILIQRFSPKLNKSIFGGRITGNRQYDWKRDDKFLTGVDIEVEHHEGYNAKDRYCSIELDQSGRSVRLRLHEFPPGSVLVFDGEIPTDCIQAMDRIYSIVADTAKIDETLTELNLVDANQLLFRHPEEERAANGGGGYHLPGYGSLPFCGLQGFATILKRVTEWNDLSHPLCNNLRDGNWAMDYIVSRIANIPSLAKLATWLAVAFDQVKQMSRHFIPKFFALVVMAAYESSVNSTLSLMSPFVNQGNAFVRQLALASVEFYGIATPLLANDVVLQGYPNARASMSAGLPHFCAGYMRAWGRDTFISLRGLMLTTGRFNEAKQLIVGFGASLRFGLIPNLLDSGTKPRYNSRDSVWWYAKAVQDMYEMLPSAKDKTEFLATKVYRLFPSNPNEPYTTIADILQEIMQSHATGIKFREPNAGREIDDKMKDEGFNIDIKLDPSTGLVSGGNLFNCGTWMDKMGESMRANNYGDPATPRDGAPIEITSMVYATARWLASINASGAYKHTGVTLADGAALSYKDWAERIKTNFERLYYIPPSSEDRQYTINSSFVRRRYVYKDTVGSKNTYSDYQFRPNQLVAMSFAPELFKKEHVVKTLDIVKSYLIGPLGVKTLDPNDTDYHANYDNSLDTDYRPTAKGFNYHNGPEWLWPYGFYLESVIRFLDKPLPDMIHYVESLLLKQKAYIAQSSYVSLPELTNRDGAPCRDSCDSQAWSIGTLLSALHYLASLQK
uniref:Glycogen debranching enzyme n=1 Tax=Synstelium polycarpum TaxID=361085 RepID=A0A1L2FUZ2_9MYCE|nr:glycogen debranching enzyme/amylo-alpha-1,6-glucosidase [Synstelium polycarpum]